MLNCQQEHFELGNDTHYINCAYQGPLLKTVKEIGIAALEKRGKPYNYSKEDFFEPAVHLKKQFNRLINGNDPERVAIIPSVSYGMANIIQNLKIKAGQKIILADRQFPSIVYPWIRLAESKDLEIIFVNPGTDRYERGGQWNRNILAAIDDNTAVIAMGNVHWTDGTLFDLIAIGEKARHYGAKLIIDGTQSIGAMPFDFQNIQPDAVLCAGYKWLLGPYSIGLAYYGPGFDHGLPIEENWINRENSDDFQNLVNYQPNYRSKANRYMTGEYSNFLLLPLLSGSIGQLLDWGPENIQEYCRRLTDYVTKSLKDLGCKLGNPQERSGHLMGFEVPDGTGMEKVKSAFIRDKVYVSYRGTSIRLSPNVYNTQENMDALIHTLKGVI